MKTKKGALKPGDLLQDINPTVETALHCRVDSDLLKEVKKAAIDLNMNLKQCVNQALCAWLKLQKIQRG